MCLVTSVCTYVYLCPDVSSYLCVYVSMYLCTYVPSYPCVCVPMYPCTDVPNYLCATLRRHKPKHVYAYFLLTTHTYTPRHTQRETTLLFPTQICLRTFAPIHLYRVASLHQHTNTQICGWLCLPHLYTCIALHLHAHHLYAVALIYMLRCVRRCCLPAHASL